ncbi:Serine/threonine protein kinase, partial [Globisporangium splendens]
MDVTFGLAVSGVGSVVSALVEIAKLCGEMREGHAVCLRLHRQLMDVSDELSAMEKRNELPKSQALSSYRDIVLKYFRFLECYREKRLFSRLVCHYKTMDELPIGRDDPTDENGVYDCDAGVQGIGESHPIVVFAARQRRLRCKGIRAWILWVRSSWDLGAGTKVVVKCMLHASDATEEDSAAKQAFVREMDLWFKFNHPHVITMYCACHVSSPPFIVCEDAADGNLLQFLSASNDNRQFTWRLLYQAALGFEYIHSHNVVRGDLKCNNILVGADGQAKIADFGLNPVYDNASCDATATPIHSEGGVRWKAPECVGPSNRKTTFASDVYSFAMCVIEALMLEVPFGTLDDEEIEKKITSGEIPSQPSDVADDKWVLVNLMTTLDPVERVKLPTVIQLLKSAAELACRCFIIVHYILLTYFDLSKTDINPTIHSFIPSQLHSFHIIDLFFGGSKLLSDSLVDLHEAVLQLQTLEERAFYPSVALQHVFHFIKHRRVFFFKERD